MHPRGFEKWAIGLRALRANRVRTLLSTLGIVIGVASLLAILNLGDSLEHFSREQITRTTALGILEVTSRSSEVVEGVTLNRPDPVVFGEQDLHDLCERFSPVLDATLFHRTSAWVEAEGFSTRIPARILLLSAGAVRVFPDPVAHGRFLSETDTGPDSSSALLSHRAAERLLGSANVSNALGLAIRVGGYPCRVVGVFAPSAQEPISQVVLPQASSFAKKGIPSAPQSPTLLLRLRNVESYAEVRERVQAWVRERFGSRAAQIDVSNPNVRHEQVRQGLRVLKLVLGCIVGISLVVGGIGIMNVQLSSVAERTREIGIRRAVGARRSDVLVQFLSESVVISGLGGLVGMVLGWLVSFAGMAVVKAMANAPIRATTSAGSLLLAFGSSFLVGIVFGLYPAKRASRLLPTEAIRQE